MASTEEERFVPEGAATELAPAGGYDELQNVCDYRLAFKRDLVTGIASLVFGGLAILGGLEGLAEVWLNGILLLIGLFLFMSGVALLAKPSPASFIADSFALGTVGVWNVAIGILSLLAGFADRIVILGVIQIGWAIHNYKRYKRISELPAPSPEDAQRVDELVENIYRAKPKQRTDIIQFQIAGFTKQQLWKARLCDDVAIFLMGKREDGVFAQRSEIEIVPQKKTLGGNWKATFKMRDRGGKGTMSNEHYLRFKEWFEGTAPAEEAPQATADETVL